VTSVPGILDSCSSYVERVNDKVSEKWLAIEKSIVLGHDIKQLSESKENDFHLKRFVHNFDFEIYMCVLKF
jgi:hypothetical protein